jgi:polysaccharide export outer membrane protein
MPKLQLRIHQGHVSGTDAARIGRSRFIRWGLLTISLVCPVVPAAAEYRVDVGDVIEILVARVPELQRRIPVKSDGTISFPLLGTFSVAGLLPSEVEAKVQATLATKIFRQRTSDGRENTVAIEPDEVTAMVVQYRPIYVNGDVSKPGEYIFRSFMTVREAVALSGGYDILRVRMENPILLSADLKGEYQSLWTELAKEQAHVSRLKSELGEKDTLDQASLADLPLPPFRVSEIVSVEAEQLKTEQADYTREKAFLQRSIKLADEQIKVLSAQETKEEQGAQADAEELQRAIELFAKGTLTSPRVTDARRAVLLSSTRMLQTAAQLMQVKRQQDDIARQLERLDDQRRIKLLQELQDSRAKLAQIRAKLQSTGEKLQYAAATRSQLVGGNELKPQIAIVRKSENGREPIIADEDSELQPGDVVEVTLRLDRMIGMDIPALTSGFSAQIEATPAAAGSTPTQDTTTTGTASAESATAAAAVRAESATASATTAAAALVEAAPTAVAEAGTASVTIGPAVAPDRQPAAAAREQRALTAIGSDAVPIPRRPPRATLRQMLKIAPPLRPTPATP